MYSEEDFQNLQTQMLLMKEDNYKLIEQCKKFENRIKILDAQYLKSSSENEILNKKLERQNIKELQNENDNLHNRLCRQEEEFKLQNGTLLDELRSVLKQNDELVKALADQKIAAETDQLLSSALNCDYAHTYNTLNTAKTLISQLINDHIDKYVCQINDTPHSKLKSLQARLIILHQYIVQSSPKIAKLNNLLKLKSDLIKTLETKCIDLENSKDDLTDKISQITQKHNEEYQIIFDQLQSTKCENETLHTTMMEKHSIINGLKDLIHDLEGKIGDKQAHIEKLEQKLLENDKEFEKFIQGSEHHSKAIDDAKEEFRICERKLNSQLKDLKRQYVQEKKRADKLQEMLHEYQSNQDNGVCGYTSPSQNNIETICSPNTSFYMHGNSNQLNTTMTKNDSFNSSALGHETSFQNGNSDDDKRSASSWSLVSNGTNLVRNYLGLAMPSNSLSNNTCQPISANVNDKFAHEVNRRLNNMYRFPQSSDGFTTYYSNGGPKNRKNMDYDTISLGNQKFSIDDITYGSQELSSPSNSNGNNVILSPHQELCMLRERVRYLEDSASGLAHDLMAKNEFIEAKLSMTQTGNNSSFDVFKTKGTSTQQEPILNVRRLSNAKIYNNYDNNHHHLESTTIINPFKKIISQKLNSLLNSDNVHGSMATSTNSFLNTSSVASDIHTMNKRLKSMLEETLTKNIMLEQNLEKLSLDLSIMKNLSSAAQDMENSTVLPDNISSSAQNSMTVSSTHSTVSLSN